MAHRIVFGTDGWRGVIARDYTFDNLSRVTHALSLWLKQQNDAPKVMLGYDCRFNGRLFAEAVAAQLANNGCKVLLSPGFVSTPMVSLATVQHQCTAGVVITASHNPPEYNGFKIKAAFGGPALPGQIAEVEARIPDQPVEPGAKNLDQLLEERLVEYYDAEALYLNHLKQRFDLGAIRQSGFRVGYDAMFGAGRRVLGKALPEAELWHADENPGFLGTAPEPIPRNLAPFMQRMREGQLDFGLVTDGDADRIGVIDAHGKFVDSHHILALLVHYLAHYKGLRGDVWVTFSVSDAVARLAEGYGLKVQVTKIGFKHMAEALATQNVLVAGEESGGIAVQGHIPERDGIYIGLCLLEFMARTGRALHELVDEVYAKVGSFACDRLDLHLAPEHKTRVLQACQQGHFAAFGPHKVVGIEDLDGYKHRLEGGQQWLMLRPSGTEPVLRMYAQAPSPEEAQQLLAHGREALKSLLGQQI